MNLVGLVRRDVDSESNLKNISREKGGGVKKLKTSLKIPRFSITPHFLAACPTTSFDHLLVDAQ